MNDAILRAADRFVPALPAVDAEQTRRARAAVFLCWLGTFWALISTVIYAAFGSPVSGTSLAVVTLSLLLGPAAIRRGWSLPLIANALTAATWLATFVVASRTGGSRAAAMLWGVFHPLTAYAVCGLRWAVAWAMLSGAQIALIFASEVAGLPFAQDLTPNTPDVLELCVLLACIGTLALALGPLDIARRVSLADFEVDHRVLERERILSDIHDGVGTQLIGLIVELRAAKQIETARLLQNLESCVDDLRLAVHALYQPEPSLSVAFAELRARLQSRCDAAGIELAWSPGCLEPPPALSASDVLQALRVVQEAFTNALRHAHAGRIELSLRRPPTNSGVIEISISDDGVGFDPQRDPGAGRGLPIMRARARRLGGELALLPSAAGTSVVLRFPA